MSLCCPSVPSTRASQSPPCRKASSCRQLLEHNRASPTSRCSAALNQRCLFQLGRESDLPPLWEGRGAPSALTEFSGFALSALAKEILLVYVGVPASHLLPASSSPVPSLFCWSWDFAAPQSHNTAKNLCVCQWVGGQPLAYWGLGHPGGWGIRENYPLINCWF